MHLITPADITAVTNSFEGASFKSYKELKIKMKEVRARLHAQWLNSLDSTGGPDGRPAYSVYFDPLYYYEAIHCFEKTKACTREMIKYFSNEIEKAPYNGAAPNELKVLDLYNGNGLTTVHLNLNGFNAESFNDCPVQVQYMQEASKILLNKPVLNHVLAPKEQYDVVLSLEVMEHYSDPLEHVQQLVELVKPGGYLVESSGFNGSSENIGHFDSYWAFGEKMLFMKARMICTKVMRNYFEVVHCGFNAAPRIWKRKLVDQGLPFQAKMAGTKKWEIHPRFYGVGSNVFCNHNGEAYSAPNDVLLDKVNLKLKAAGKPTLFEEPTWYANSAGPTSDFTLM